MSEKLLFSVGKDDFDVQTFRSGGKGGQNQNKRDTGVRIIHRDSGARGEARDQRSQAQNKRAAFKRMAESPKFKVWLAAQIYGLSGQPTLDEMVDEWMRPEHLRVETKKNGRWEVEETHDE